MSVVAESTARSARQRTLQADPAPSSWAGHDGNAWQASIASGTGNPSQQAMPLASQGSWRPGLAGGELMSVVAESSRRSGRGDFQQPGAASSMWSAQVGSERHADIAFDVQAAQSSSLLHSRSTLPRSSRISDAEFARVEASVRAGLSTDGALASIGRSDLPASTVRRWLRQSGVGLASGNPSAFSAAQIESAMQAQAAHVSRTGSTRGSVRAAYESLGGSNAGKWSTFRDYIGDDGLTPHGQAMLERSRAASESARSGRAEPGS